MVGFYTPHTLDEALELLANRSLLPLSGGTDVVTRFHSDHDLIPLSFPKDIIYVGALNELKKIEIKDNKVVIGGASTIADILRSSLVPEYIKRPLRDLASPPIREMATMGGNICNASPVADSLPMLFALDAEVNLVKKKGSRAIKIRDFIVGPGKTLRREDELLYSVMIPIRNNVAFYWRKIATRGANSISKATLYGCDNNSGGVITDLSLSFGGLSATPVYLDESQERIFLRERDYGKLYAELSKRFAPIDDERSTKDYKFYIAKEMFFEMGKELKL